MRLPRASEVTQGRWRLPNPNPNPKTHPNPNPIFNPNPNPFLKENKNDTGIGQHRFIFYRGGFMRATLMRTGVAVGVSAPPQHRDGTTHERLVLSHMLPWPSAGDPTGTYWPLCRVWLCGPQHFVTSAAR